MSFKNETSSIRTIRRGEKNFMLTDGLVMAPRAGFEISNSTPREYRQIISECIDNGWLKPVAYVKDVELFWQEFSK